jgi:hypothetical protein
MTIHKEYPEGWKWAKLDKPGQFAAESDEMGHSVRGYEPPKAASQVDLSPYSDRVLDRAMEQGIDPNDITGLEKIRDEILNTARHHPDWIPASGDSGYDDYGHGGWGAIKSGKAEVYSLKDPKGNSKATVEVGHIKEPQFEDSDLLALWKAKNTKKLKGLDEEAVDEKFNEFFNNMPKKLFEDYGTTKAVRHYFPEEYAKHSEQPHISQIKGPQNRKPSDDALPFIQDFVKSKEWSAVEDLENSGMTQEELRAHQATFSK